MVLLYLILVVISLMIFGVDRSSATMTFFSMSVHHHNTRSSMLQIYDVLYFDRVKIVRYLWFYYSDCFIKFFRFSLREWEKVNASRNSGQRERGGEKNYHECHFFMFENFHINNYNITREITQQRTFFFFGASAVVLLFIKVDNTFFRAGDLCGIKRGLPQ